MAAKRSSVLVVGIVVVLAGAAGLYFLSQTGAAPFTAALEAENGTVAGCASKSGLGVTFQTCGTGSPANFTPAVIPLSDPEIANPLRGQYSWISHGPSPADFPILDVYYRDELQWAKELEPTQGQYNFASIEKGIQEAVRRGGQFSFRVMAACPGCGGTLTPGYVARQSNGAPDWNSESFLTAYANLMKAIGAKYDKDPRINFVDVGGYGSWGEYHIYQLGGATMSRENSKRMIKSVLDAFPSKFVLMMTPGPEYLSDAMAMSPRIGIRVDCVGTKGMTGSKIDDVPAALERWKTAPWVAEWCGNENNFQLGLDQVRKYHISNMSSWNMKISYEQMNATQKTNFIQANKESGYRYVINNLTLSTLRPGGAMTVNSKWSNVNVGVTYHDWNIMYQLRNPSTGTVAFEGKSSLALRTLLPTGNTPKAVTDNFTLPANLSAGNYDFHVKVVSPEGYLKPMQLAIQGKTADGSYKLGSVKVQ